MSFCDNCKTDGGPHFIPPSFGDPGFFICDSPEKRRAVFRAYYERNLQNYAPGSRRWLEANLWLEENPR